MLSEIIVKLVCKDFSIQSQNSSNANIHKSYKTYHLKLRPNISNLA